MAAIKVTAARVPVVRSVESRYTLQGRNRDREKHRVANGGHWKVDDMLKEAKEHIIGGDRGICKESIIRSDNIGGDRGICKESISLSDNIDGDRGYVRNQSSSQTRWARWKRRIGLLSAARRKQSSPLNAQRT